MVLDFAVKDVIHKIAVKFFRTFLPNAKKTYNLKAVYQPELDIRGIASKAAVYNIATSPKVIEEGLISGMELMYYLAADGYKIKTPLFNLKIRIPGEYNGHETSLPEGIIPVARMQTTAAFRKYLKERVRVEFAGIDDRDGIIAEVTDEATGIIDEVMTVGNILTIRGTGIKIDADDANKDKVGVFFKTKTGSATKANVIALNEPKTLKVLVPAGLKKNTEYNITVETQCSAKSCGTMCKKIRTISSDFTLTTA